jgi:hypothetical protein
MWISRVPPRERKALQFPWAEVKVGNQREDMPTPEEHILRILSEAKEPLFASEIADHLNRDVRTRYTNTEMVELLKTMAEQVAQLSDGRWMLKRLML